MKELSIFVDESGDFGEYDFPCFSRLGNLSVKDCTVEDESRLLPTRLYTLFFSGQYLSYPFPGITCKSKVILGYVPA